MQLLLFHDDRKGRDRCKRGTPIPRTDIAYIGKEEIDVNEVLLFLGPI